MKKDYLLIVPTTLLAIIICAYFCSLSGALMGLIASSIGGVLYFSLRGMKGYQLFSITLFILIMTGVCLFSILLANSNM